VSGPRLRSGDALLLATALIWGLTFPVAKHVLAFLPPLPFAAVRYLLAALLLLGLLRWRQGSVRLVRADILPLLGIGLIGITVFQSLWANGLALTSASKAAILVSTSPIWAAVFTTLRGQRLPARAWAGVFLSLGGVFLVVNNSVTEIRLGGGTLLGDLMFLAGAALWAVYSALAPPYLARLGPLKVTAWTMLLGALGLAGAAAVDWAALPLSTWAAFAFTVVLSAALGFLWWYEGIRQLGVNRAMVYSYLIPVSAVASAVLLLGESFGWAQILGSAVVLAGIRLARGA
jgi:drug/metabolite transporter (DMT)-like permease